MEPDESERLEYIEALAIYVIGVETSKIELSENAGSAAGNPPPVNKTRVDIY